MIDEYSDWYAPSDDDRPRCPVCRSHHVHVSGGLHWCDVCGCEREVPTETYGPEFIESLKDDL